MKKLACTLGTIPFRHDKEIGSVWNWRTSCDHLNYNIIEIGKNTNKNPENLRKLAVTQPLMKYHQLIVI